MRAHLLFLLVLVNCGKGSSSEPTKSSPASAPKATAAAADEPAAVAKLDQTLTLDGLGVVVSAPACAKLSRGDSKDPDAPASIEPSDPSCRGVSVKGVRIHAAGAAFDSVDKATATVTKLMRGNNATVTNTADGYRLTYDAGRSHGVIVARTIGSTVIACRSEGTATELATADAICASLKAK